MYVCMCMEVYTSRQNAIYAFKHSKYLLHVNYTEVSLALISCPPMKVDLTQNVRLVVSLWRFVVSSCRSVVSLCRFVVSAYRVVVFLTSTRRIASSIRFVVSSFRRFVMPFRRFDSSTQRLLCTYGTA